MPWRWPMVGRITEVETLAGAYERARDRSSAVVLTGEAGIGKSRLVNEFASSLADDQVVYGSCLELAGQPIVLAAIEEILHQLGRPPDGPTAVPDSGSSGPVRRLRQFESWATTLQDPDPGAPPLVVVIEDLHWADETTLDFLNYLIRSWRRYRLMLIMTRRDDEPMTPRCGELLAEILRLPHVLLVHLDRLTLEESERLVEVMHDEAVEATLLERLYRLSEGNPYLLGELSSAGGEIPIHVRDILASRVQGLGPDAQFLVRLAAVAGLSVDDQLLWSASAIDDDRYLAGMREAVAGGVLRADRGRYAFQHSLTREAILEQLLPLELRRLHSLVATGLEKLHPSPDVVVSAAIAAHWNASGERAKAISAGTTAAQKAYSLNAFAEAWRHYQRVLELRDWGDAVEGQAALISEAAEAARWAGDVSAGVRLLRQGLEQTASTEDQASLHERLARYLWDAGSNDSYREYSLAADLLDTIPPTPAQASVLAGQARVSMLMAMYARAEEESLRALEAARRWHLTAVEADALNTLAVAEAGRGDDRSAVAHLHDALSLAQDADDFETICRTYGNLAFVLEYAGDHAKSCVVALEGLRALEQRGLELGIGATLANNAASILLLRGRYEECEALLRELLTGWTPQGQSLILFGTLAELQLKLGRFDEARSSLSEASALMSVGEPHTLVSLHVVEAELLLAEGRYEMALDTVSAALRGLDDAEDDVIRAELCRLGLRVEAERLASPASGPGGDHADAVQWLITQLPASAPEPEDSNPGGLVSAAMVATARAEAARSSRTDTWEAWREAAGRWSGTDRPWDVAYCRLREAERAIDRRLTQRALEAGRDSWTIAQRLHAQPLLDELTALSRRGRIPPGALEEAQKVAAESTGWGLTPREIQVLELLATGATNRAIAHELFISDRTAAVHVSNLLRKLMVDNRVQAAAIAGRVLAERDEATKPPDRS